MLSEKLHLREINRLHQTINQLKERIEQESDKEKKSELCLQYFHLTELWMETDEFIEFTLKQKLDSISIIINNNIIDNPQQLC